MLSEHCTECHFDPAPVGSADIAPLVRAAIPRWIVVLDRPDVSARPDPRTWSPLEYACHIRDVFTRFDERLRQILDSSDPLFANWDQAETAIQQRYWPHLPAVEAWQLHAAGNAMVTSFENVRTDQRQRPGRRSEGSQFTIETLGRYIIHDPVHHLNDVNA